MTLLLTSMLVKMAVQRHIIVLLQYVFIFCNISNFSQHTDTFSKTYILIINDSL